MRHGGQFTEWGEFSLAAADPDHPPTTRLHLGFAAPSRAHADAFWRAGVDAGAASDGDPGPRPRYGDDYYGAFLLDPDGNSVEAVHHGSLRPGALIDHVWLRVADLGAARRFYETIAPFAGLAPRGEAGDPPRVRFTGAKSSLSVVHGGPPAANVHIAFPGDDDAVSAFHAAAVGAGYRDNGWPGERPEYHRGYVGAFVLDPDGNNVEVVDHNR